METEKIKKEFPPFPYDKHSYKFEEFISYEQQSINYDFYCSNFSVLKDILLESLDFSVRIYNVLKRSGINVLGDMLFLPLSYFLAQRNFGKNCMFELIEKLSIQLLSRITNIEDVNLNPTKEIDFLDKQVSKKDMSVRAYNILCENNLLNEFAFLSMADDSIRNLRRIGRKTSEELIHIKKNKLSVNKGFFISKVKAELKNICAENFGFDLMLLSSRKLKGLFTELGIRNISDFSNIQEESIIHFWEVRNDVFSIIEILSKNIIKTIESQFEWDLLSNTSGKKKEKDAERNIEILKNRAKGLSLIAAGERYFLTRERVRQIELKKTCAFNKLLQKNEIIAFLTFLCGEKSYLAANEIEKSIKHGDIFSYFLKKSDLEYINYIQEMDAFILGENWFVLIEYFIENLPSTTLRVNFKNEIEQLFAELHKQGILFDRNAIENIIVSKFIANGDFFTRSKLTLLTKYRIILEKHFSDGISVYNDLDLDKFRRYYHEIYDDDEMPDSNRALVSRIVDNCVLIGRGRYALKKDSYISNALLGEIYEFIISNPRDIVMTNAIFHKFEKQLTYQGVDNKYYLQGVLKQHNTYGLFFTRDYISKTKEKSNIYNDVLDFIKSKQGFVNITEIKKEFPAIPESVLSMVLNEGEVISAWNKNYIHKSNIEFDEQDEFYDVLKDLVSKEKLISDNKVFSLAKKKFADFMANNHINTPFFLYGILKSFFNEKFRFSRPHIIDNNLDIVKGVDLIRQHFAERENLQVIEIKNFAREKDIPIYSFIDLVNSLDQFLLVDKENLINSSKIAIDENTLSKIEQTIEKAMDENDYAEISKLNLINSLPSIGIKWTNWLLYAIIYRYSSNFEVITSSNYFHLASPLIMKNGVGADFVREMIEGKQIDIVDYRIDDLSDIDNLIEELITEKDF